MIGWLSIGALASALAACGAAASAGDTARLGAGWELMVDRTLIAEMRGTSLAPNPPRRCEVALVADRPWEGPDSAYYTVLRDGATIRLYYRGRCPTDASDRQVTCMAESRDGVTFTRPALGLYDVDGSKANNVVYQGVEAHNFAPFIDTNPARRPGERYKAVAGINSRLYAFVSADGVRWRKLQSAPVITDGAFDSLNTAFWDARTGVYRC